MADWKDDIEKYLQGEMTPAEMHALEKKALNDPFLADALEGAESVGGVIFNKDITHLQQQLADKQKKSKPWIFALRIAASFVLLLTASYLVYNFFKPAESGPLAQETPKKDAPATQPQVVEEDHDARREQAQENPASPSTEPSVARGKKDPSKLPVETKPAAETHTESSPVSGIASTQASEQEEAKKSGEASGPSESLAKTDQADAIKSEASGMAGAKRAKTQNFALDAKALDTTQFVTGRITSSDDGTPIPGANVIIGGTDIGAVSNKDGEYQLVGGKRADTLVISSLGYKSKQVSVPGGSEPVNVSLPVEPSALNEVIVTSYDYPDGPTLPKVIVELALPEGGKKAYNEYLEKNLRYPVAALKQKTEGKVTVEFSVDTEGEYSDFTVIKGLGNGCEEEVIRLIKEGPSWKPSTLSGAPVKSKVRVRVKFKIPK